jgi:integration host factor subunit alpha
MVSFGCNNLAMELLFDSIDLPTLTKLKLADFLFEKIGFNKREAREFIDAFFESIIYELAEGRDVKISGFGNFEVRNKPARPGRNPRTGESVTILSRRVITFKAGGQLKEKIN